MMAKTNIMGVDVDSVKVRKILKPLLISNKESEKIILKAKAEDKVLLNAQIIQYYKDDNILRLFGKKGNFKKDFKIRDNDTTLDEVLSRHNLKPLKWKKTQWGYETKVLYKITEGRIDDG